MASAGLGDMFTVPRRDWDVSWILGRRTGLLKVLIVATHRRRRRRSLGFSRQASSSGLLFDLLAAFVNRLFYGQFLVWRAVPVSG